ncbi:FAD:protein FMN transferase [Riemerella columbina]|uniref:FAD:protein FMN transferase n=1 Tax=Riemerella columbina TaxID=103810 RepID=UPI00266E9851|nr:FAD:protein FMN transferase [Riemerella columbina]WKS94740.1 FAD:protein FMN transferase [Riemerella columbina]
MKPLFRFKLGLILALFFHTFLLAQVAQHRAVTLMGSRFDITIVDKDSLAAEHKIDLVIQEISRIENLISEWQPHTIISEVNRNAGIRPVVVPREVFELTQRALYFSKITDGAFDISTASMDKIWRFDGSMPSLPPEESIRKSVQYVDYRNIILDETKSTIFLKKKGMKIGFGATGKGYAAEKGKALMQSLGVKAGIVNASGDMAVWGLSPKGKPWRIGITNPFRPQQSIKILSLQNEAIVTSGDYEKYVILGGRRYAHIINPKTGYPSTGLTSVTIKGPNAEFANGLSTSIMVLGLKKGKKLMKQFPDYHYYIITDSGRVVQSKGF